MQEITDEFLKKSGITRKIKGVVVIGIDETSPAFGMLSGGDIITEINRRAVVGMPTELMLYVSFVPKCVGGTMVTIVLTDVPSHPHITRVKLTKVHPLLIEFLRSFSILPSLSIVV